MPRVWLACIIVVSLGVAVALSIGAARETTGQPWQPPPPTATARVIEVRRLQFVEVTATPEPTRYTEYTYRAAQRAGTIPMPPTPEPTAIRDASGVQQVR